MAGATASVCSTDPSRKGALERQHSSCSVYFSAQPRPTSLTCLLGWVYLVLPLAVDCAAVACSYRVGKRSHPMNSTMSLARNRGQQFMLITWKSARLLARLSALWRERSSKDISEALNENRFVTIVNFAMVGRQATKRL